MSQSADRNLLFGILALQNNFVTRETLLAAFNVWVADKSRPLGELLVEQGKLNRLQLELLNALADEHLKQHGNDTEQSLAVLSSGTDVRDQLGAIADEELHRSLTLVGRNRIEEDDPFRTETFVGQSTSDGGRFRILRPHAKGGLGEVFVAQDGEVPREVALKQIKPKYADDAESRGRFLREAAITGGLEHPGIVPVYGLGTYGDGRPFYAMRFIRGDSLQAAIEQFHGGGVKGRGAGDNEEPQDYGSPRRVAGKGAAREGREVQEVDQPASWQNRKQSSPTIDLHKPGRMLKFRELLGRFLDVCHAIAYAHSRGVLHRDLKPGNIMLGKFGETLVVDWGLAKATGASDAPASLDTEAPLPTPASSDSAATQMGSTIGTPAYMSPEQAAGRLDLLGKASDIYSLGATLYCLLTGQPPQTSHDLDEVLSRIQRGEYPRPREIKRDIPKPLEAICLKAMARNSEDRYDDAVELAADVQRYMGDEATLASPESLWDKINRFARRNKALVRIVAIVLTFVAVGSSMTAILVDSQRRENLKLATKNGELAREKTTLAEAKVKLAASEKEARENAEQTAEKLTRELRRANALRLAAQSVGLREARPQTAGLLAIAAVNATRAHGNAVVPEAQQALIDVTRHLGGEAVTPTERRFVNRAGSSRLLYSRLAGVTFDGRWLLIDGSPFGVTLWGLGSDNWQRSWDLTQHQQRSVVCTSNTGRWLVTRLLSSEAELEVWDLGASLSDKDLAAQDGHPDWVSRCSPPPPALQPVKTVKMAGGGPISHLPGSAPSICSQGRWLCVPRRGGPWLWDLRSPPIEPSWHDPEIEYARLSDDGTLVAFVTATNELRIASLENPNPFGGSIKLDSVRDRKLLGLQISSDNRYLGAEYEGDVLHVWKNPLGESPRRWELLKGQAKLREWGFRPNGDQLIGNLSGATTGSLAEWNLTGSEPVGPTVIDHIPGNNLHLRFSPRGEWLAVAGRAPTVYLRNLLTKRSMYLHGHDDNELDAPRFSADEQWLYTSELHSPAIRRWDLAMHELRTVFDATPPSGAAAYPPDLNLAARRRQSGIALWDLRDHALRLSGRDSRLLPAADGPICFSADGKWLAGFYKREVRLWSRSGLERFLDDPKIPVPDPDHKLKLPSEVNSVSFSDIGQLIVVTVEGPDLVISRFQIPDFTPISTAIRLVGRASQHVRPADIHLTKAHLVIVGSHYLTVKNLKADQSEVDLEVPFEPGFRPKCLFTADDRELIIARTGKVQFWDLEGRKFLQEREMRWDGKDVIWEIRLAPNGRWLVVLERSSAPKIPARLIVADLQAPADSSPLPIIDQLDPLAVAISNNSQWIAVACEDNSIRIWELGDPQWLDHMQNLVGHAGPPRQLLAFSPDDRHLLSQDWGETVRRWELNLDDQIDRVVRAVGRSMTESEKSLYRVDDDFLDQLLATQRLLQALEKEGKTVFHSNAGFTKVDLRAWCDVTEKQLEGLRRNDVSTALPTLAVSSRSLRELLKEARVALHWIERDLTEIEGPITSTQRRYLQMRFEDYLTRHELHSALGHLTWWGELRAAEPGEWSSLERNYARFFETIASVTEQGGNQADIKAQCESQAIQTFGAAARRALETGSAAEGFRVPSFLRDTPEVRQLLTPCAGKGAFLEFNLAFRSRTRSVPQVLEGESLRMVNPEAAKRFDQDMIDFPADCWSGGKQLLLQLQPEETAELEFSIAKNGDYDLGAVFTRSSDFGTVQLTLDGKSLRDPLDLFHRSNPTTDTTFKPGDVIASEWLTLGKHPLSAGVHRLGIKLVGTNPKADPKGFFGLDYLTVDEVGANVQRSSLKYPRVTASHTSPYDLETQANDGIVEFKTHPHNRWTAYQSMAPTDWLQVDFGNEREFSRVEVAIYDESPGSAFPDPQGGGVRIPQSFAIEYLEGEFWKPVVEVSRSPEKPTGGSWNEVRFQPVKTGKVRVVFAHQAPYWSGVTEVAVWP